MVNWRFLRNADCLSIDHGSRLTLMFYFNQVQMEEGRLCFPRFRGMEKCSGSREVVGVRPTNPFVTAGRFLCTAGAPKAGALGSLRGFQAVCDSRHSKQGASLRLFSSWTSDLLPIMRSFSWTPLRKDSASKA